MMNFFLISTSRREPSFLSPAQDGVLYREDPQQISLFLSRFWEKERGNELMTRSRFEIGVWHGFPL